MNKQLIRTAKRVNWYVEPEVLLKDESRFLCEVMARGSQQDVVITKSVFPLELFIQAYKNAPPGLFDRRSWAYWGLMLFSDPDILPYPERFPDMNSFDWRS